MAPVPEFYSHAQDNVGVTPDILRQITNPTSNLTAWQRNPVTDMSPELRDYKQSLRDANPEASGIMIPQEIVFNNGEKLILRFDQTLIRAGYEHLKGEIQKIGNAIVDNAGGLPVTFFPGVADGLGQSSLKFLSPSGIKERISKKEEDDYFHLDGLQDETPEFAPDRFDQPSVSVTVITDIMGNRRTRVLKANFVQPVAAEMRRQLEIHGPTNETWNNAVTEIEQRTGQKAFRHLEQNEVGAFAIMPRGMLGRHLFDNDPSRVFGLHSAPVLEEGDDPRLTLVLRGQIGGFKPKVGG
jgi:hypothetical protein